MNMKNKVLATALFAALGGMTLTAQAAPSDNVTLQGVITKSTCDVTVNGGAATLMVGSFRVSQFTAALTQVGSTTLPVLIDNCTAAETGDLVVIGTTSSADASNQLFVAAAADTAGFMIKNAASAQVANNTGPAVTVAAATPLTYNFTVGMGATTTTPAVGAYSTPVTIAYLVP